MLRINLKNSLKIIINMKKVLNKILEHVKCYWNHLALALVAALSFTELLFYPYNKWALVSFLLCWTCVLIMNEK